jgi:hypothetical protein
MQLATFPVGAGPARVGAVVADGIVEIAGTGISDARNMVGLVRGGIVDFLSPIRVRNGYCEW